MPSVLSGEFMRGDACQQRVCTFSSAPYFLRAWHTLSVLVRTVSAVFLGRLDVFASQEVDYVFQGTEEKSGLLEAILFLFIIVPSLKCPPCCHHTPSKNTSLLRTYLYKLHHLCTTYLYRLLLYLLVHLASHDSRM